MANLLSGYLLGCLIFTTPCCSLFGQSGLEIPEELGTVSGRAEFEKERELSSDAVP